MIPFDPDRSFETYYIEIDPDTTFSAEPHQGNVYEYIFVNQGTLGVTVGDQEYSANANEFLQFQANHHHAYRCIGIETTAGIMQICYLN